MTPRPNHVTLTSAQGALRIEPCVEELKSELSFLHKFAKPEEVSFMRGGMMQTLTRKGKLTVQLEPLYDIGEDGAMYTHDGLLHRTIDKLRSLGIDYSYERIPPAFPEPVISPEAFEGLYPEQKKGAILMLSSTGGASIEATTALGKTRIIKALVMSYPGRKVLISSHSSAVVRGLKKNLSELMPGIEVGIVQGVTKKEERVTVCTNAMLSYFDPDGIDVYICDECHKVTGETVSSSILRFVRAVKYGLSATMTGRFDGKDRFIESLFGPIVFTVTDQEAEENGRVCPTKAYFLSVPKGPSVDELSDQRRMKLGVWRNPQRNQLVKRVCDRVPADQQVLVFVETIEHMNFLLEHYLPDFEICHADLTNKQREEIENRFVSGEAKRLIATSCLSTGVDPRALHVLIDLSGVKGDAAMVQKRGRLRRWAPGKHYGVLINFMDEWSPRMARKAMTRLKEHQKRGDKVFTYAKPEEIAFDGKSSEEEDGQTGITSDTVPAD